MDILFDDEEGLVNEVGWLLLQNLKEDDLKEEDRRRAAAASKDV